MFGSIISAYEKDQAVQYCQASLHAHVMLTRILALTPTAFSLSPPSPSNRDLVLNLPPRPPYSRRSTVWRHLAVAATTNRCFTSLQKRVNITPLTVSHRVLFVRTRRPKTTHYPGSTHLTH